MYALALGWMEGTHVATLRMVAGGYGRSFWVSHLSSLYIIGSSSLAFTIRTIHSPVRLVNNPFRFLPITQIMTLPAS